MEDKHKKIKDETIITAEKLIKHYLKKRKAKSLDSYLHKFFCDLEAPESHYGDKSLEMFVRSIANHLKIKTFKKGGDSKTLKELALDCKF